LLGGRRLLQQAPTFVGGRVPCPQVRFRSQAGFWLGVESSFLYSFMASPNRMGPLSLPRPPGTTGVRRS
jgi:hypothetical protein